LITLSVKKFFLISNLNLLLGTGCLIRAGGEV